MKLHIHSGNKYPYKLIALWFCELVRKSRMDKASLTWVATVKSQRVKLVSITKSWSCESHEAKTRGEAAAAVRAYQQWWKSIQYGNVLFKCQTFFAAIWHNGITKRTPPWISLNGQGMSGVSLTKWKMPLKMPWLHDLCHLFCWEAKWPPTRLARSLLAPIELLVEITLGLRIWKIKCPLSLTRLTSKLVRSHQEWACNASLQANRK